MLQTLLHLLLFQSTIKRTNNLTEHIGQYRSKPDIRIFLLLCEYIYRGSCGCFQAIDICFYKNFRWWIIEITNKLFILEKEREMINSSFTIHCGSNQQRKKQHHHQLWICVRNKEKRYFIVQKKKNKGTRRAYRFNR